MEWQDPIVADVRRHREELSAKFEFDVAAIFADLRKRQGTLGDRLVRLSSNRKSSDESQKTVTGVRTEKD